MVIIQKEDIFTLQGGGTLLCSDLISAVNKLLKKKVKIFHFVLQKMAARQERLLAAKDISVRHKFADKAYNNVSMVFVVP